MCELENWVSTSWAYIVLKKLTCKLAQDEQRQLDQQQVQLQKKQQQQAQQHQLQQQTQQQHDPSKKSGKSTSPAILEKLQIKQENTGI